jgi:hypothetical protein
MAIVVPIFKLATANRNQTAGAVEGDESMIVEHTWESSPHKVTGAVTVIDHMKSKQTGWEYYRLYSKNMGAVTPMLYFSADNAEAFFQAMTYFKNEEVRYEP